MPRDDDLITKMTRHFHALKAVACPNVMGQGYDAQYDLTCAGFLFYVLNHLTRRDFDVILLDLVLQGRAGYESCGAVCLYGIRITSVLDIAIERLCRGGLKIRIAANR